MRNKFGNINSMLSNKILQQLQNKYGDRNLRFVPGYGRMKNPTYAFIFMHPTAKNISTHRAWNGIVAPWIGTKVVWRFFYKLGLLSASIFNKTQNMKANQWTPQFANTVYQDISKHKVYITNFVKVTTTVSMPLPVSAYVESRELLVEELNNVKPSLVVALGATVASRLIKKPIALKNCHTQIFKVHDLSSNVLVTYYPVGQGIMNMQKAVEDIKNTL